MLRGFVRTGTLHVIDAEGGRHELRGTPPEPAVTLKLHDPALYGQLLRNAKLHIGEAYMDGTLTLEGGSTLTDLLALFGHNQDAVRDHPAQAWLRRVNKVLPPDPAAQSRSSGARTNVAHHYDLSRRLYELFLDDDLQYSWRVLRARRPDARRGAAREEAPRGVEARARRRSARARHRLRLGRAGARHRAPRQREGGRHHAVFRAVPRGGRAREGGGTRGSHRVPHAGLPRGRGPVRPHRVGGHVRARWGESLRERSSSACATCWRRTGWP